MNGLVGIHGHDADCLAPAAQLLRDLVGERALPRPRGTRHPDDVRFAGVVIEGFEGGNGLGDPVFDHGHQTGHSAGIALQDLLHQVHGK